MWIVYIYRIYLSTDFTVCIAWIQGNNLSQIILIVNKLTFWSPVLCTFMWISWDPAKIDFKAFKTGNHLLQCVLVSHCHLPFRTLLLSFLSTNHYWLAGMGAKCTIYWLFWTWVGYVTSLGISFLIYKIQVIIPDISFSALCESTS